MYLYKAVLVSIFGRGSRQPLRRALVTILALGSIAAALGIWLATHIPALPFSSIRPLTLLAACTFIVQAMVIMALLSAFGVLRPSNDRLSRILTMLPLKRGTLWMLFILPGAVLAGIVLCFIGPLVTTLLAKYGSISWWGIAACLLGSAINGLSIVYGVPRRWAYLGFGLFGGFLWLEYRLLSMSFRTADADSVYDVILMLLLAATPLLLWISRQRIRQEVTAQWKQRQIHTSMLPASWWYTKKIYRSKVTRHGFWITFGMSGVFAIVGIHSELLQTSTLGGVSALLVAAFVSDVRRGSRTVAPPEILTLRGTRYFACHQLIASMALAVTAVCPLIICALSYQNAGPVMADIIDLALNILFGVSAGLCASTFFTAGERDITAQCSATLMAIGLLFLPYVPWITHNGEATQHMAKFVLGSILLGISYAIEHKRNNYYWRTTRVTDF